MRLKNKILAAGCVAAAAAALVTGLACNEHEIAPFSKSLSAEKTQSASSGSARTVDILFVIDNSNSMEDEQRDLDKNFGIFLDKLIAANADFHLAVVSTEWPGNPKVSFETRALMPPSPANEKAFIKTGAKVLEDAQIVTKAQIDEINAECAEYFGNNRRFISSSDEEIASLEGEAKKAKLKSLFRCEAMLGLKQEDAGVERGLATMAAGLANRDNENKSADIESNRTFKRKGSILSIVFVTDENDCSDVYSNTDPNARDEINNTIIDVENLNKCETARNIEDSCTMTREDRIVNNPIDSSSMLRLSSGGNIEYKGVTKTTREWCVQGDETAREALQAALDNCEQTECSELPPEDDKELCMKTCQENLGINCPNGKCQNYLNTRRFFYDKIISLMVKTNKKFYKKQNADLFEGKTTKEQDQIVLDMARQDVIIANIINRDRGIRYNDRVTDTWCGGSGNESYRYQLFGEMFDNDPLFAPICCKREAFMTPILQDDPEANNVVCDAESNGANGQFGPVLGAIGRRIGEAINTLCTETAPLTCDPADCNMPDDTTESGYSNIPLEHPKAACPCMHGCNTKQYFSNSEREYYLCNEFRLDIGSISTDADIMSSEDKSYTRYEPNIDYSVDYESNYCFSRTGSPIQLNLNKTEANRNIVIEYPKRVNAKK